MVGAGNRHQGEIGVYPVPGAGERSRQQRGVIQAVEHQHRALHVRHVRRGEARAGGGRGAGLRRARVVRLVVVQHGLEIRLLERGHVAFLGFGVAYPERQPLGVERLVGVWLLEVEGVLAVPLLIGVGGEFPEQAAGVGQVQDHQQIDELWARHGHVPRHRAAPIVAHHDGSRRFLRGHHRGDIRHQQRHGVLLHALGLVALVVAAHVQRGDAKAIRQRRHLVPPRVPEVRKAVQEHRQRRVLWPGHGIVDANAVAVGVAVINAVEHGCSVFVFARRRLGGLGLRAIGGYGQDGRERHGSHSVVHRRALPNRRGMMPQAPGSNTAQGSQRKRAPEGALQSRPRAAGTRLFQAAFWKSG